MKPRERRLGPFKLTYFTGHDLVRYVLIRQPDGASVVMTYDAWRGYLKGGAGDRRSHTEAANVVLNEAATRALIEGIAQQAEPKEGMPQPETIEQSTPVHSQSVQRRPA